MRITFVSCNRVMFCRHFEVVGINVEVVVAHLTLDYIFLDGKGVVEHS